MPPATSNAQAPTGVPGADPREIAVGEVLRGRYQIKSVLGRGGMGTVLEAVDQYRLDVPDVDQRVAIKVLHSAVTQRPELLAELRREFVHLQSLSHPNIVRVHEFDRDGNTAFFTMEYLSGLSLSRVLSARHQIALNRPHALAIIRDVGAALAHAHGRGVVHGDLNPGNIFITDDGVVRVLDFGASHTLRRGPWISDFEFLEQTPIATPRYASCQLLEGETADMRDDLYAFACLVYLLLTGKHPFGERTALQARTLGMTPVRPEGLTQRQWRALRLGLSFGRDRRPANVEQWLRPFKLRESSDRLPVLLALLRVSPRKRSSRQWAVLSACAVAVMAAGWWVATNFDVLAQRASASGVELKAALTDVETSLTQLWRPAPDAGPATSAEPVTGAGPVSDLPAAKPPATPSPVGSKGRADSRVALDNSRTVPATTLDTPRDAGSTPRSASSAPQTAATPAAASSRAAGGTAPHSRIELASSTIDVPPGDPSAHVVVRRKGNLHGDTSFSWWTESGTAKPGQDFVPVAPHEEHFESGKSAANLFIPLVTDTTRREPKSFYVVIGDPSPDASLGDRNLLMVTILPSE
jgi:serine/threonine protein kinase